MLNLLSSMYLCKPSREALESWKLVLGEDVPDLLKDLRDSLYSIDLDSEQELEDLLWEYTRLFIGPYKLPCPPWESVYTSAKRLLMQEAYAEVKEFYNEVAALTINDPNFMPDHIGAELNFLAILYEKMNDDPKGYYSEMAERFLKEHLKRWVPQFTQDLQNAADTLLYRALAIVTASVVNN